MEHMGLKTYENFIKLQYIKIHQHPFPKRPKNSQKAALRLSTATKHLDPIEVAKFEWAMTPWICFEKYNQNCWKEKPLNYYPQY